MKGTPIGLVMLNDARKHVYELNAEQNMAVVRQWAEVIRNGLKNQDGTTPEVITASKTITSVQAAHEVGEELARANVKQLIMCYNVWNFPYLAWPLVNSLGEDIPDSRRRTSYHVFLRLRKELRYYIC